MDYYIPEVPSEVRYEIFPKTTILSAFRGSIAHGMYIPPENPDSIDDIDLMSVVVPTLNHYFGLEEFGSRGTKEKWVGKYDTVTYEFLKFVNLLCKGNPNVLSLLWMAEPMYIVKSIGAKMLIDNRKHFMTMRIYPSFTGYAHGQLEKMTRGSTKGYMGEKRKQLVEKFGYDTKNAAHLIRLLRMGIEALETGELFVYRYNDAEELLDIKKGKWSLEKVQKEADKLFTQAKEASRKTSLQEEPDREFVNTLCINIIKTTLRGSL
jgi:uncharacterized protein